MKTFRIVLAGIFVAFFSLAVAAQSPSKVISQANKALGGEKALKAVSSTQVAGRITRVSDGATGAFRSSAGGEGLYAAAYDLNGIEFSSGYNGKSGWMRDSKDGLRTVTGDAGKEFQAEAAYRNTRWLRAKDEKAKLTSGGTASVDGRPANVVVMTTAKGVRIKLYFDSATGMLVREEIPANGMVKVFDYSDYRVVGTVRAPFFIKSTVDGEAYSIAVDGFTFNRPVERTAFDFPKVSNEPIPNISGLLDEVRLNAAKLDDILENYSFTQKMVERDLNKNGEFVEKESEKRSLTFYKGYRISRTIEKNNRPLSPSDQAKEDKEAEKQVAEIEKRIAERERRDLVKTGVSGQPSGERRFTLAEALKGSLLVNPRRETFRGREVIVFDYEPDPAFKPKTRNEKLFALCVGAVWVDAATKQVVRLDAVLSKSAGNFLAKAKRGTSFSLENEFVNNEIWLPSRADINVQIKVLFLGIDINNLVTYGDYRKFRTEVKDAVVGDEKKP